MAADCAHSSRRICSPADGRTDIGELTALRWRDVDLASGRITVGEAKTDAGRRTVDLSPALRDELAAHKATTRHAAPADLVFGTRMGRAQNRNNIRRRILLAAVKVANGRLAEDESEIPALPDGLSPHALRHTFASLLFEAGATVPYVMAQLGHADPKVTLGIYAHVLRRKGDTGDRLDALVRAADWAATGSESAAAVIEPAAANGSVNAKTPH
jgi:integrase